MGLRFLRDVCRVRRGTRTRRREIWQPMHHPQTGSPDAGARTSPSGRGDGSAGGPSSKQVVDQEIRCTDIRLHHELSWMQISDDGHERTLGYVAGCWRNAWLKTEKRNSGKKQQSFVLTAGWRVELDQWRNQRKWFSASSCIKQSSSS